MKTKEMIINECVSFLDANNVGYSLYEENGVCLGVEFETWTDGGVDMVQFIDGRGKNMEDPDWWKRELSQIYNRFNVDEEIELHRQDKSYRSAFSIRRSLEDFEDYEKWLEDLLIKAYDN